MTEAAGGQVMDFLANVLPWSVKVVVSLFVVSVVAGTILRLVNYWRKFKQKSVLLEVTPPAFQNKVPVATTQLYSVLHGLLKNRTIKDSLLRYAPSFSLEIVSTRKDGIRFLIRTSEVEVDLIKQTILSYAPDSKIKTVQDYISEDDQGSIQVFRQSNHFAFSLDTSKTLTEHDPVAYLTGAMTKLEDDELMSFQMVITPAAIPEASRVDYKIRSGHWSGSSLQKRFTGVVVLRFIWIVIRMPFWLLWGMLYGFLTHDLPDSMKSSRPEGSSFIPPAEQALLDKMHDKLSQDLFRVELRSLVISETKKQRKDRGRAITNALATYATPKWQSLKPTRNYLPKLGSVYRRFIFTKRLPALLHGNSNVLGSAELAAIFHFPHSTSAKTENVVKSLSKSLPAPVSMKGNAKLDVILGANNYHGTVTPIGLTADQRERHTYIIGGTGNGKTTLVEFAIIQDMLTGKGLAFIDPHGDAAEKLLRYVPKDRIKDVIYLNPADISHPIGINLLELPKGLSEDEYIMEKERVTEAVVSTLRKVFSDDEANAHRIESMLRNAIRTAFYAEDPTLFTILKLIRNQTFRNNTVAKLDDDDLKDFWREEFGKAGGMQRVSMSKGLTSRLDRFRASAPVYRMFSQTKSTISFEDIMNESKILICNFSSEMGEDTSALFGTTVLAKLKIAAERRKNIPPSERRPFYVYVDEFQNFATTPFTKMLSTARKYRLFLTIAEQSTAQQEEQRMVETILGNVGTMITFRTGSPLDEQLMLSRFSPQVEEGDIGNLPAYNFYMKVAGVQTEEPMSGQTLLLDDEGSTKIAEEVIASSRKQYARKYVDPKKKKSSKKTTTNQQKDEQAETPKIEDEDEPAQV